jgi:hypothetical protein
MSDLQATALSELKSFLRAAAARQRELPRLVVTSAREFSASLPGSEASAGDATRQQEYLARSFEAVRRPVVDETQTRARRARREAQVETAPLFKRLPLLRPPSSGIGAPMIAIDGLIAEQ